MKIKNKNYRKFLDEGEIEIIDSSMLTKALNNISGIRGSYIKQARALIIYLFYTGCRPVESFKAQSKDIYKNKSYCVIKAHAAKKGKSRLIYLSFKKKHVKELYDFAMSIPGDMFLFPNFKSLYVRKCKKKNGEIYYREEVSDKLRYHFQKWFKDVLPGGVTTYYLRHNIFSLLMMKGADEKDIKHLKGARSLSSVDPYIHLSSKKSKTIARYY